METILILGAIIIGFTLVVIAIPPILRVARAKNLFDSPDERKIHTGTIPPLGGIAIFIGFVISTIIATDGYSFDSLKYIIASVILMFFIGLKDDLMIISPRKKLIVQIFACVLLISLGNVRFTSLHGIFGIYEIHYITSLLITLFAMIVIVNSFNLVDGIDGLASGLAILAGTFFGTWFFLVGQIQFSIMSFALVGSLAGFFLFNVFGKSNKLFMGDTGSLIIGLVISTLVVKFNEFNVANSYVFAIKAAPSVSFAVIIVPLIDTLKVMSIRIKQGKSPFSPDNNHLHHRLLVLVPNHFKVTLIIVSTNIGFIGLALALNTLTLNVNLQLLFIFLTGIFISSLPLFFIRYKSAEKKRKRKLVRQPG